MWIEFSTQFHRTMSDSVLSKTAIFPQKEGRKREISNESARCSSLRETNEGKFSPKRGGVNCESRD